MPVSIALLPLETVTPKFRIFMVGENDTFPTLEFLESLEKSNKDSYDRLMAILGHVSSDGPITNDKRKSRRLNDEPKIFEFKTPDQNRIAWFYDRDRVIVCTHGFRKPSKKELQQEIAVAVKWHKRYSEAKADKTLVIIQ